ncbi:MAG: DUF2339 domain-containing protein [Desulfamplus sp.]|nr:DUF2339 domain-containing protein [Desulfamplus sp.]
MNFILLIILIVIIIELFILRKRVAKLEAFKENVESEENVFTADDVSELVRETPEKSPAAEAVEPAKTTIASSSARMTPQEILSSQPIDDSETRKTKTPRPVFTEPTESALSNKIEFLSQYVKNFFTTGNVVLKFGMIILFFGVSFLLKYAAQRNMVPIEFRLAGVALGGTALIIIGWILAKKRAGYGLVLQGGGIGILYLTVFAAAKLYNLLPNTFSFVVMFCLVVLSGILAVLQDSKALAAFGASGGFLAPVLMSTGTGSHVMLFSYYALLNAGILGIAWFKAWREINLIGFFFTFVIFAFWGYRYYQPSYFASTEPFLLLFFVFYVFISILFAHRQPVKLRGFVDGPLVFGLPIVFFGMQASLVENHEYGVALSALGLGAFYILTATLLWKRLVEGMRILTEAFLALGVVFSSLAIPFALDGHATASAWALEGAAMVWVGLRQKRILARNFGIILQIGAALSYLAAYSYIPAESLPFANEVTLGGIFIALGALFSSYQLSSHKDVVKRWESLFHLILLGWGVIWWIGTGVRDIEYHSSYPQTDSYILLFFAFTALLVAGLNRTLSWLELQYPLYGYLPVLVLAALATYNADSYSLYFEGIGLAAWIISLVVLWLTLRMMEDRWNEKAKSGYHMISLWLLIFMLTNDTANLVDRVILGGEIWSFVCFALVPGLFVLTLLTFGEKVAWPIQTHRQSYLDYGVLAPLFFLVLWSLSSNFMQGDPAPLPYIPLLNPLTVCQLFVFLVIIYWLKYNQTQPGKMYSSLKAYYFWAGLGGLMFLWLNGVTARLVHLYFGVPFDLHSMFNSVIMQSAISILWSSLALTVTIWANRKGIREVWFGGAVLLSGVVIKLFLVDLSGTGTIARIVSFLAVGVLMLLIGYFSPLPLKKEEDI